MMDNIYRMFKAKVDKKTHIFEGETTSDRNFIIDSENFDMGK